MTRDAIESEYRRLVQAGWKANPAVVETTGEAPTAPARGRKAQSKARNLLSRLDQYERETLAFIETSGFIGFDGAMDTNILIRTFTAGRGWVQFPVGGGIVADSVPEQEYEETWHKAEGLLRALR